MVWPALALVEGLSGSGKSTTAQWIAHELGRQGRAARWIYEEEVPHPVLSAARGPWASWKACLGDRLTGWAAGVTAARTSDTATVLDSTFLQASVYGTLSLGLDPATVLAYVERVADLLRPLDPALVYVREADPDAAIRRICERRGAAWTFLHLARVEGMAWATPRAGRSG